MKRKLTLLLCFIIAACFFGCKRADDYGPEEKFSSKFPDYQYNQETAQYYANAQMAIAENGYYYKGDDILYKYDIDKDISVPMCSRAECNHNSKECDAYAARFDFSTALPVSNCIDGNVMYYNNHIYMVERTEPYETYLMQYDENFNNKEVLAQLTSDKSHGYGSQGTQNIGVIVDGYYYYFGTDCRYEAFLENDYYETVYCNRIKLEKGAKREVLGEYEFGGDFGLIGGNVGAIYISGENVWFIEVGVGRFYSKTDPVQCTISVYNTKTNEFKTTKSYAGDTSKDLWGVGTGEVHGISRGAACMDSNNNLYVVSQTGQKWQIVKVNLIDNSSGVIYISEYTSTELYSSSTISGLTCDGNNIFFFETDYENKEYRMTAISLEGKIAATMKLDYEDSYIDYLKKRFEKKGKEAADRKELLELARSPGFKIFGTDERYIVIANTNDGIKGLSSGDSTYMKNTGSGGNYPETLGVGIINKADFLSGKDCEIKQIYRYFDNH